MYSQLNNSASTGAFHSDDWAAEIFRQALAEGEATGSTIMPQYPASSAGASHSDDWAEEIFGQHIRSALAGGAATDSTTAPTYPAFSEVSHSDDWAAEIFAEVLAEGTATGSTIVQQSPPALHIPHQFIATPLPLPNDYVTVFDGGNYPSQITATPFPTAALMPNIWVSEQDAAIPTMVPPTPNSAAAVPGPATTVATVVLPPSHPTTQSVAGYEVIYKRDFATRLPTPIATQLRKCKALGALLYIVPAAKVDIYIFHEPAPLREQRVRNVPGGNGTKKEKQCDVCQSWLSEAGAATHRRRHYPPVWKCEHCEFCLIRDLHAGVVKTREKMRSHYVHCLKDREALPSTSRRRQGGSVVEQAKFDAPPTPTTDTLRRIIEGSESAPLIQPALPVSLPAQSAWQKQHVSPKHDGGPSAAPSAASSSNLSTQRPAVGRPSKGTNAYPWLYESNPGYGKNGTIFSAVLSSSLNKTQQIKYTIAEQRGGAVKSDNWPETTDLAEPVSWAGIYGHQHQSNYPLSLSSSLRDALTPRAGPSTGSLLLNKKSYPPPTTEPPIPRPASIISNTEPNQIPSASTTPAPTINSNPSPPPSPLRPSVTPHAPLEASRTPSPPIPETPGVQETSTQVQDKGKGKEKAQDEDAQEQQTTGAWSSGGVAPTEDFPAFLAQYLADDTYNPPDWRFNSSALQKNSGNGKRKRVEVGEEEDWEYDGSAWTLGVERASKRQHLDLEPVLFAEGGESEVGAVLINATGEELSEYLLTLTRSEAGRNSSN